MIFSVSVLTPSYVSITSWLTSESMALLGLAAKKNVAAPRKGSINLPVYSGSSEGTSDASQRFPPGHFRKGVLTAWVVLSSLTRWPFRTASHVDTFKHFFLRITACLDRWISSSHARHLRPNENILFREIYPQVCAESSSFLDNMLTSWIGWMHPDEIGVLLTIYVTSWIQSHERIHHWIHLPFVRDGV